MLDASVRSAQQAGSQADWTRRGSSDDILPPAAAAPMHAPPEPGRHVASPSVWDDVGDPGAGAAESTASAKRVRWRRRRAAGGDDGTSPGLAQALERLETARGVVEAGPDIGDLLLDFLHVRPPLSHANAAHARAVADLHLHIAASAAVLAVSSRAV